MMLLLDGLIIFPFRSHPFHSTMKFLPTNKIYLDDLALFSLFFLTAYFNRLHSDDSDLIYQISSTSTIAFDAHTFLWNNCTDVYMYIMLRTIQTFHCIYFIIIHCILIGIPRAFV